MDFRRTVKELHDLMCVQKCLVIAEKHATHVEMTLKIQEVSKLVEADLAAINAEMEHAIITAEVDAALIKSMEGGSHA